MIDSRHLLHQAFLCGAADMERRSALLDSINVFPVVDADTGANMSQSLRAGVEAISAGKTDFTEDILLGARGNSGVILAQFLVGLFDALRKKDNFDSADLWQGISVGRDLAYEAVADPVEGTMLTVMTDLVKAGDRITSVRDMAAHGDLERTLAGSVARTPELMPRLKEAGVVDSGALGFHVFASGLTLCFLALQDEQLGLQAIEDRRLGNTRAPTGEITRSIDPDFLARAAVDESRLRYCMDVVISTTSPPKDNWKHAFAEVGGSVDAILRGNLIKLHVHSNDPEAVKQVASALGEVTRCTLEDMTEGMVRARSTSTSTSEGAPAAGGSNPAKTRIIGDSSMSLPFDLAADLGVARLENHVNVHGRMIPDCDLELEMLFAKMRDGNVFTTAQTSPEEVRRFLDKQLSFPGDLVYVAVGDAYTGTQKLVRTVVDRHPEGERVTVLDSCAASGQQGLAVLASARKIPQLGDASQVVDYAREQISSCSEYLVIDSLQFLSRSGRVGKIKAAFAGAMGVRPIVGHGPDGAITHAKARSHEAALEIVVKMVADHPGEGPLLVMLEHTDNRPWLDTVREALEHSLTTPFEVIVSPLSSTSAVHMGPGTWGVVATRTR